MLESANELFYSNPETNLSENDQLELNTIQSAGNCSSNELSISLQEFQIEQRKDPDLHPVFQFLENNELTGDYKTDVQIIAWSRYLTIQNNLLFHFQNLSSSNRHPMMAQQLVVPFSLVRPIINLLHSGDLCGHPGVKKKLLKKPEIISIGNICSTILLNLLSLVNLVR